MPRSSFFFACGIQDEFFMDGANRNEYDQEMVQQQEQEKQKVGVHFADCCQGPWRFASNSLDRWQHHQLWPGIAACSACWTLLILCDVYLFAFAGEGGRAGEGDGDAVRQVAQRLDRLGRQRAQEHRYHGEKWFEFGLSSCQQNVGCVDLVNASWTVLPPLRSYHAPPEQVPVVFYPLGAFQTGKTG
jgi:hypothetical protein